MRKLILAGLIISLITFAPKIFADQPTGNNSTQGQTTQKGQKGNQIGRSIGEAMRIRSQMRKMENDAIQSDPKLKQMDDQIKALVAQLQEKVSAKLQNNQKYQDLKTQMSKLKEELKGKREEMHGTWQPPAEQ